MYKENITAIEHLVTNYFEGIFMEILKNFEHAFITILLFMEILKGLTILKVLKPILKVLPTDKVQMI